VSKSRPTASRSATVRNAVRSWTSLSGSALPAGSASASSASAGSSSPSASSGPSVPPGSPECSVSLSGRGWSSGRRKPYSTFSWPLWLTLRRTPPRAMSSGENFGGRLSSSASSASMASRRARMSVGMSPSSSRPSIRPSCSSESARYRFSFSSVSASPIGCRRRRLNLRLYGVSSAASVHFHPCARMLSRAAASFRDTSRMRRSGFCSQPPSSGSKRSRMMVPPAAI